MSDIPAILPVAFTPLPPTAAAASSAAAVIILEQPPALSTQVQAQIVALEKLANAQTQVTLQTEQGQVVVQTAQKLDVGQTVQLKILSQNMSQNVAQLLLLPNTKTPTPLPQAQQVLPQQPVLPNTTLPVLGDKKLAVQTLIVQTPLAQLPSLLADKAQAPILLQTQLQQWQILPQSLAQVKPQNTITLLPQVLGQGLQLFQNIVAQTQNMLTQAPLEKLLAQQLLGQVAFVPKAISAMPSMIAPMQTSSLPLLAVQQPVQSFLPQLVGVPQNAAQPMFPLQVFLPGSFVGTQTLATPFAPQTLQSSQPWLVLGQVPQAIAPLLQVPANTPLVLTPQGFAALPPQIAQSLPTLPGTLLLMQPNIVPQTLLPSDAPLVAHMGTHATPQIVAPQIVQNLITNPLLWPASGLPALSMGWDVGDVLWQGLDALGLLQHVPQHAVPNLAQVPSLPLALMQLLGAFKKNDIGAWLGGDMAQALGKTAEGRKLLQTFGQMANKHTEARQEVWRDAWQSLPLPLLHDDKWHVLPVFYRHQENTTNPDDKSDNNPAHAQNITRFLVQMPQTAWGHMQLDGFLQKQLVPNLPTQLDMVLRTEKALALTLAEGLQTRYAQVLGALGYVGQIVCQCAPLAGHVLLQPVQQGLQTQG